MAVNSQSGIINVVPALLNVANESNMTDILAGHCKGKPPAKNKKKSNC